MARRSGMAAPVTFFTALAAFERSARRVTMPCSPISRRVTSPEASSPFSALTAISDILLLPVRVVEDRADDARLDGAQIALRVPRGPREFQHLAHPVGPVQHEAHGDATAQRRREIGRG